MDIMALGNILVAVAATLGAGLALWNFFQSPSKENASAISGMNSKLTDHDRRIQAVEGELKHLPSKDDFHELRLAIVDLKGTVSTLAVKVGTVDATVAKIDTYLRKDDAK